jgi:O-6-methylguanine DNA methyltransferase
MLLPLSKKPPVGAKFLIDEQMSIQKVFVTFPFEPWEVISKTVDRSRLVSFTHEVLVPWAELWLCGIASALPISLFPSYSLLLAGLGDVPCGTTISYTEFARKCGKAVRPAARLLSTNPIPLVLPCHRVIAKNGAISGYLAGGAAKSALLSFEKSFSI